MSFDKPFWRKTLQQRDLKLAFFDVDGTLLNGHGEYSLKLQTALEQLRGYGVKTAIASGRPPYAARFLFNELGLKDAGLFNTGALIYNPCLNTSLVSHCLPASIAQQILTMARQAQIYVEVCTADHFYVDSGSYDLDICQLHRHHLRVNPDIANLDALIDRLPVHKLLLAVDVRGAPGVLQKIEAQFPSCIFAYACLPSRPELSFVSIVSGDACKHRAFDQLLSIHQVRAEQVIAFGDADSDKIFLQRAGLGVAMGSANDDVKGVADAITLSAEEDGVALVLETWLELQQ